MAAEISMNTSAVTTMMNVNWLEHWPKSSQHDESIKLRMEYWSGDGIAALNECKGKGKVV